MCVTSINSKKAITHFRVLERYKSATLIELSLETGRTHQIRVHMNYIGHPVIGDPIYGKGNRVIYDDGQLLFAHEIKFIHPKTKKEMTFSVNLPQYFKEILEKLR
jgi:23S rRNA pseudouridine1911/1915/1917 synthase